MDCPKCTSSLFVSRCLWCHFDASPLVAQAHKPCVQKCAATIYVQDSETGAAIAKVQASLDAGTAVGTDPQGFRTIADLDPGPHSAKIVLTGLEEAYAL